MVIALSLEGTPGTMTQAGTRGVPSCHCNCVREWVTCSQPDLHMPPLAGLLGGSPGSWPSPREQPPLGLVSNHQGLSQHVAPHGSPPPDTTDDHPEAQGMPETCPKPSHCQDAGTGVKLPFWLQHASVPQIFTRDPPSATFCSRPRRHSSCGVGLPPSGLLSRGTKQQSKNHNTRLGDEALQEGPPPQLLQETGLRL